MAKKVNRVLGCIRMSIACRLSDVILPPPVLSTVETYLEVLVQVWTSQYKRDIDELERVCRRLRGISTIGTN